MNQFLLQTIKRIRAGETTDLSSLSLADRFAATFVASEIAFRNRDRRLHDKLLEQLGPLPPTIDMLVKLRLDFFEQRFDSYSVWLEMRDELIKNARGMANHADFWLLETYYWLATLAWHSAPNELGFSLYQMLQEKGREIKDWNRVGSALANLASLALAEGDAAKGALFQQRLEELHGETSEPLARIYALDLKVQLLATVGDADQAWQIFCSLESGSLSGFPGIYVFSVDYWVYINLLRRGWMKQARTVEVRLQKWFQLHQLANYPEAMECATLQKFLRFFDFDSLRSVLRHNPDEFMPLPVLRSVSVLAWLELAYRFGKNQAPELSAMLDNYDSWSRKSGLFCEGIEIALLKLSLREPEAMLLDPVENRILQSIRNGFRLETIELLRFKIEILIRQNQTEQAAVETKRSRDLCVAFGYDYDAILFERILAVRFGRSVSDPLNSLNVVQSEAHAAADRLLSVWPWNNDSEGKNLEVNKSPAIDPRAWINLAGSSRVKALLELLLAANGEVVAIDTIVRAVWNEEYNPLSHDNRVYQIVKEARRYLAKNNSSGAWIQSSYGGKYSLSFSSNSSKMDPKNSLGPAKDKQKPKIRKTN